MPIPCKDAVLQRRQLHYFPRCDAAGRYERRQCSQTDCMCVSPDTGIVLEKTLAMREKNISCDEGESGGIRGKEVDGSHVLSTVF